MKKQKCQMQDKDRIHEGKPEPVVISRHSRFTQKFSHKVDPKVKYFIKRRLKWLKAQRSGRQSSSQALPKKDVKSAILSLKKGDMVRVRSITEIHATLTPDNRLKGLKFLPEMEQYCDTVQRVFKPVESWLNECDYTVRKGKGLVLLENVFCNGISGIERCDRSCFYFWRVEWLEKKESSLSS